MNNDNDVVVSHDQSAKIKADCKNNEVADQSKDDGYTSKNKSKQLARKEQAAHDMEMLKNENSRLRNMIIMKDETLEQLNKLLAEMTQKYNEASGKLNEYRNTIQAMRRELKMAHKALCNEVGEGYNLPSLVSRSDSAGSKKKGRAQQILLLQNKVDDLRSELQQYRNMSSCQLPNDDVECGQNLGSSISKATMSTTVTSSSINEVRQRGELKRLGQDRQETIERLREELSLSERQSKEMKERCEAQRARLVTISEELRLTRTTTAALREKTTHDDELIAALMEQQTQLKQVLQHSNQLQKESREKLKEEQNKITVERKQYESRFEQMNSVIWKKEEKIKDLERMIADSNIGKACETCGESQNEVVKINTLRNVAEIEARRLQELVTILNERMKTITLEAVSAKGQVVKLQAPPSRHPSSTPRNKPLLRKTQSTAATNIPSSSPITNTSKDAGSQDEIAILQQALQETLSAKSADLSLYQQILEETKLVFVDTYSSSTRSDVMGRESNEGGS